MNIRWIITGTALGVVVLLGVAAFFFQDNLAKFLINPRTPYETYSPPAQADYTETSSWLHWPTTQGEKRADVFYISGTAYASAQNWNAPVTDEATLNILQKKILPNEAGPFYDIGDMYAPLYRQATLFAFFTQKHQGRAARKTAYADIQNAFDVFLTSVGEDRPIVLVGYGQGGLHLQGLLIDYFQDNDELRRRLLAAYIIDQSTPLDLFNYTLASTPPCKYQDDVRCVVSWNAYEPRHEEEVWRKKNRPLVWNAEGNLETVQKRPLLCTNPLDWRLSNKLVERENHLGAATATGLKFGEKPALLEKAISVQCDGGIALISRPRQRWLQRPHGFGKQWQTVDYNLFYEDIRINLEQRYMALAAIMEEEARNAPPMMEAIDLEEAPINKVPK